MWYVNSVVSSFFSLCNSYNAVAFLPFLLSFAGISHRYDNISLGLRPVVVFSWFGQLSILGSPVVLHLAVAAMPPPPVVARDESVPPLAVDVASKWQPFVAHSTVVVGLALASPLLPLESTAP